MSAVILKNSPTAEAIHFRWVWEAPWAGALFLIVALAVVAVAAWQMHRRGQLRSRIITLTVLRVIPIVIIAFLLARPVRLLSDDDKGERQVVLLMDRSSSMSLEDTESESTRYKDSIDFTRATLLPALKAAGLKVQPMLFAAAAEKADADMIVNAVPDGEMTDLSGAISSGLNVEARDPLALVALTDGAANQPASNRQAVNALLASKVPFVGVGFGTERGVQTLNLMQVDAPDLTPPKSNFRISARIEATVSGTLPAFDLVLMRDGKFHDKRRIEGISGSRFWSESFQLSEEEEGVHTYHVRIDLPDKADLVLVNDGAKATVRVTKEQELRVLYMQGALTWDYKFIGTALRNDPTVQVTGLSRTSERSVFRQNVEAPGELIDGFPDDVKELAPFRAVILANLSPADLSPAQQEAIARFCGDFGGGVLMIGGRGTFDASWQGSRLEQLLPVRFEDDRGVHGLDEPFQLRLTAEAMADPMFEIAGPGKTREAWEKLPSFDDYGRVAEIKPGATIWAVHSKDLGPDGKPRILMASQPYGSGLSAVIALQNFWKWRLAKDSDQSHFDRFWQQFIRRLAESGRQAVRVEVLDQELRPGRDIGLTIEKMAEAGEAGKNEPVKVRFQVRNSAEQTVTEQRMELFPGRPENVSFHPQTADLYTIVVQDESEVSLASRVLEIRAPNIELQATARDMANLQQWAMLSGGSAWTVEEARQDPDAFAKALRTQIEAASVLRQKRETAGMNLLSFLLAVVPLCAGWILRKRWMLT